jgi:hypothetical protein
MSDFVWIMPLALLYLLMKGWRRDNGAAPDGWSDGWFSFGGGDCDAGDGGDCGGD